MRNYLQVKHGFSNKQELTLEEEAKNIDELEAKIHRKIADFTNQLEPEKKYSKRDIKREKYSRTSSSDSDSKYSKRDIKHEKYSRSSSSDSDSSSNSLSSHRQRKIKQSPNSRRYSLSPSRKFKRSNKRDYSPSPNRRFKRSPSSDRISPNPSRSHRPRLSKSLSPVRVTARIPMSVKSQVSVDELGGKPIQDLCKYLDAEETKDECIDTISQDFDMQNLIIRALYALNRKVEDYYENNVLMCNVGIVYPLQEESLEMHNNICQLLALYRDSEE